MLRVEGAVVEGELGAGLILLDWIGVLVKVCFSTLRAASLVDWKVTVQYACIILSAFKEVNLPSRNRNINWYNNALFVNRKFRPA